METKKKLMTVGLMALLAVLLPSMGQAAMAQTSITSALDPADPTFNRPEDSPSCTPSGFATAVYYEAFTHFHGGGYLIIDMAALGAGVGTLGDPFLALYSGSFDPANPCVNFVASDDDSGVGYDSIIFVNLPPGQYVIVATSYANGQTGTYQLTVTTIPQITQTTITGALDPADPTFNRPEDTPPCTLSGSATAVYYEAFTHSHGGGYLMIDMASLGAGVGTLDDPFLVLYSGSFDPANPCVNFAASDDDGGVSYDSRIMFGNLPPGQYVIVATSYSNGETGTYQLTITSPSPPSPPNRYTLSVDAEPASTGSVRGDGIACPGDCSESYDEGTMVRLTAGPSPGYVFDRWSGCSAPTNICDVIMDSDVTVTAHFREGHRLEVNVLPPFGGRVTGDGIDCPNDCRQDYISPTSTALNAQPNQGFMFLGWAGCSSEVDSQCTASIESEAVVRALFSPETCYSTIYREERNVFSYDWMLFIPVLEAIFEDGSVETYWVLMEYLMNDNEYFAAAITDYGPITSPAGCETVATLDVHGDTGSLHIPACEAGFDPGRFYWWDMDVDFTSRPVRVDVVDYGLVQ